MRVGFVGLGNMGQPMARNLAAAGHQVTAYNRTRSRAEALAEAGVRVADTPADAARDAQICITMLSDDAAVESVVFGRDPADAEQGAAVLPALPRGAVHVSMSTISVALSRVLQAAHTAAEQGYVAAPVFGRPEAAEAAKLWVVAAGPEEQVERCRPLFDAMSRGVSVIGSEPSSANVVKLAGNFTIAAMIETLAECFALARKSGVDAAALLDVLNGALYQSPLYANYGRIVAEERFEPPGFRLRLGLKDARLVLAAADAAEVPMPLASLVHDHFLAAAAQGHGDSDWAAMARVVLEAAGL